MAIDSTSRSPVDTGVKTIRFLRRGEAVCLNNVPPSRTLLEVLREDLGCTGTKEGCGEGDCGACTVVLAEIDPHPSEAGTGSLRYRAVNSCIRLAHSVDGMALWTVEDIAETPQVGNDAHQGTRSAGPLQASDGPLGGQRSMRSDKRGGHLLHPAQQAMVENHASQCGFCTPGFVMSLFAMYQNHVSKGRPITRELAQEELSGNLCRCTGYRPILDAAQQMSRMPPAMLDESLLLSNLQQLAQSMPGLEVDSAYKIPKTLAQLLQLRSAHPKAQIVAGCTDVGLWVNKLHMQFSQIVDVTRVLELRRIDIEPGHLRIGAAVPLSDAFAALVAGRPQLGTFANRFAGLPVRNSGTLGGNIANGSPIGDSMPLLIALNASVVLASLRGEREMPLEALYTGYRQNVIAADEVLAFIRVPQPLAHENVRVYKISKRYDDDISAVCLALNLHIEGGLVASASIGAGGVAATPVRAVETQAALVGQPWTQETVARAMAVLRAEFSPISDMRATSTYRVQVLGNLLQRFWLESQGMQQIRLEAFDMSCLEQAL